MAFYSRHNIEKKTPPFDFSCEIFFSNMKSILLRSVENWSASGSIELSCTACRARD